MVISSDFRQDIVFNIRIRDPKNAEKELIRLENRMKKLNTHSLENTRITNNFDKTTGKMSSTISGKAVPAQQKINDEMKRFKMEALGIMFGGMAIANMFSQMTRAGFDLYKIGDILNTTYGVMMLPVMDILGEAIFGMVGYLMNLSDEEKMVVGTTMLLGQVLGTALSGLGQTILFISSLKQIGGLGGLIKSFKDATGFIKTLTDLSVSKLKSVGSEISKILTGQISISDKIVELGTGIKMGLNNFMDSKLGRGVMTIGGAGLLFHSIIMLDGYDSTAGVSQDELYKTMEMSLGAGMLAKGLGASNKAALVFTAVVAITGIAAGQTGNKFLIDLQNALIAGGLAVLGAGAAGGATIAGVAINTIAIPIGLVVTGITIMIQDIQNQLNRSIGGILLGAGTGAGIGSIFGGVGAIPGGILGAIGGLIGSFVPGLFGMATGGIVTKPTIALIGEAGPEAVVPLNNNNNNNNTQLGNEIYAPEIYVNANISSDYDVNTLAEKINSSLYNDYKRRRMTWA